MPFTLILNHVYAGADEGQSAKLPFFLLGEPKDGEASWKKFRDGEAEGGGGKKQKAFMERQLQMKFLNLKMMELIQM